MPRTRSVAPLSLSWLLALSLLLAITSGTATAQESPQQVLTRAQGCAKLTDPGPRLACFDKVFSAETAAMLSESGTKGAPSATTDKTARYGAWAVLVEETTGSPRKVHLSTNARQDVRSWLVSARPVLFIRCSAGRAEAFVDMGLQTRAGEPVNGRPATTVGIISDKGPEQDAQLYRSTDGKALFFNDALALARLLVDRPLLGLDVPLAEGGVERTEFPTEGLRDALAPFTRDCGFN